MVSEASVMFHWWGRRAWQRGLAPLMAARKQRGSERGQRQHTPWQHAPQDLLFPPNNISFNTNSSSHEPINELASLWMNPLGSQHGAKPVNMSLLEAYFIFWPIPQKVYVHHNAKRIHSIPKSPHSLNCSNSSQKSKFKVTSKTWGKLVSCEPR